MLRRGQAAEGVHDAPDGTEQADVRAGGTDGGEERQALLELLFFTGDGDAHGPANALHDRIRVDARLLAQAREFLEAGAEHLFYARIRVRVAASLTVQLGQVDARPEALFKAVQRTTTGAQHGAALKNHDP
ncbi:hypothetical protein D3C76_981310 [compost metagenome]